MRRLGMILATAVVMLTSIGAVWIASPAAVYADAKSDACAGISLTGASCSGTGQTTPTSQLDTLIGTVVNILTIVVGVIAVIMIIVAGAKFITSGGDTSKVAGARSSIIYAVIGLVIVVLAQTIVHYVINKV